MNTIAKDNYEISKTCGPGRPKPKFRHTDNLTVNEREERVRKRKIELKQEREDFNQQVEAYLASIVPELEADINNAEAIIQNYPDAFIYGCFQRIIAKVNVRHRARLYVLLKPDWWGVV